MEKAKEVRAQIKAAGKRAVGMVEMHMARMLHAVDLLEDSRSLQIDRLRAERMQYLCVLERTVDFSESLLANEQLPPNDDLPKLLSFLQAKSGELAREHQNCRSVQLDDYTLSFNAPDEQVLSEKMTGCIGDLNISRLHTHNSTEADTAGNE